MERLRRIAADVWDYFKYIVEEIRNEGKDEDEFIWVTTQEPSDNLNGAIGGHIKVLGS